MNSFCFVTSLWPLIFKNWCKVPLKSNKQKNFMDPTHWKRQTFLLSQKPEGPALSERVPSLLGLKGAPPPPHSSYISGSQTQPSRSKTRQRGNIRTSRRAIVAPHRLWNHKKGIIQPWDSSIKCSFEVCTVPKISIVDHWILNIEIVVSFFSKCAFAALRYFFSSVARKAMIAAAKCAFAAQLFLL